MEKAFLTFLGRWVLSGEVFSDCEQTPLFLTADHVVAMENFRHCKLSLQFQMRMCPWVVCGSSESRCSPDVESVERLFFSSQKPMGLSCSLFPQNSFFLKCTVCVTKKQGKAQGKTFSSCLALPSFSEEVQTLLRTWDMSLSPHFSSFTPLLSPQAIIPPPPTYLSATCLFLSHAFCGLFMLMYLVLYFSWCLECHCSIIKPVLQ